MCGGEYFKQVFWYTTPDRYESALGITDSTRGWFQCCRCRFYQQWHSYDSDILQDIYSEAYWDKSMRNETPKEAAHRVLSLPLHKQDNWYRGMYITRHCQFETVADVGAGLGLLSRELKRTGKIVDAVEQNTPARKWIRELGIRAYRSLPEKTYDLVILSHVLEHVRDAETFLGTLREHLNPQGSIFIEVPDAISFKRLPPEHDDFNSCHLVFYDTASMYRLLDFCGYELEHLARVHNGRKLSRLVIIAKRGKL